MILVVLLENILNCVVDRSLCHGFVVCALHRRNPSLEIEIILNNNSPQGFAKLSYFCTICLEFSLKCSLSSFFIRILL